jgi:hypothetical protein
MQYSQDQRDKHRKPLSAGRTMLGLVITETDHVTVFCDLCAYVCSVCVDMHMCERELSDFSDWTIQHSNPGRSNRLFSSLMCPDWLWDPSTQQQRSVQWLP